MLSIAIVGAGPRGTAALSAIAAKVTQPVTVHLFGVFNGDGVSVAGQGTPFDVTQPEYSRFNARTAIVDQFGPYRANRVPVSDANPSNDPAEFHKKLEDSVASLHTAPDFDTWAKKKYPQYVNDFPPRKVIGEYLVYCYEYVKKALPKNIELVEHGWASKVSGVPGSWRVTTGKQTFTVDELLLTVGHSLNPPKPVSLEDFGGKTRAYIPFAYPLSILDDIDADAVVAVRGAGLTFIDVALALTEGRGGKFSEDGSQYVSSKKQVKKILPLGLEGIFLDIKPNIDVVRDLIGKRTLDATNKKIRESESLSEILDLIRGLTLDVLKKLDYPYPEAIFDGVVAGSAPSEGNSRGTLADSIAAYDGKRKLGAKAVFAGVFLLLADAILDVLPGKEWPNDEWETFRRWNSLVDIYGFGPPPINARKILTLIDAGVIDTSWLDKSVDALELPESVDVVVDGVLAPGGYWPGAFPELAEIEDYLLVWNEDRNGIRIGEDASVLDSDLKPVNGLAAFGRITEEWELGMDTLNSSLHGQLPLWAERIQNEGV
ncbi:diaminopimelate decarboxylase [Arcanobacterium pluranimalium]|uniref:FAD/NAD(P)-binding protein n=1 Tax=Arcanobacterium pluranimalium TaxID=108028 RepID=UPI00195E5B4B|nr:FAD/NAD(P)-binding protein [Arcanobacterium pluranimalium]MBM7824835.1 diaminopimelate decarboxylase [Arcanobacterium pluranimalium]